MTERSASGRARFVEHNGVNGSVFDIEAFDVYFNMTRDNISNMEDLIEEYAVDELMLSLAIRDSIGQ